MLNIDAKISNADWPKRTKDTLDVLLPKALGGKGSGNFGHAGRPGSVGGSSAEGSLSTPESKIKGPKSVGEYIKQQGLKTSGEAHMASTTQKSWEKKVLASEEKTQLIRKWKNGAGMILDPRYNSKEEYAKQEETFKQVDTFIKSAPQFEGEVWRGTARTFAVDAKIGKTFTVKTPLSTTRDPKIAKRFTEGQQDKHPGGTLLRLETKSGAAVENLGLRDKKGTIRYNKEREVIVPRGVRYQVTSIQRVQYYKEISGRKYPYDVTIVHARQVK